MTGMVIIEVRKLDKDFKVVQVWNEGPERGSSKNDKSKEKEKEKEERDKKESSQVDEVGNLVSPKSESGAVSGKGRDVFLIKLDGTLS